MRFDGPSVRADPTNCNVRDRAWKLKCGEVVGSWGIRCARSCKLVKLNGSTARNRGEEAVCGIKKTEIRLHIFGGWLF